MTNIQICSDLHFEFHRDGGDSFIESMDPTDVDVLVLAGDIGLTYDKCKYLSYFQKLLDHGYKQIVFVLGNHEFYHSNVKDTVECAHYVHHQTMGRAHYLHCGDKNCFDLGGGKRIIGDTMWFQDRPDNDAWYSALNDRKLTGGYVPFVYEENIKFHKYLESRLTSGDIVVTHHIPSMEGVPLEYKTSPLNRFFVDDMEGFIETHKPSAWIFGHTHGGVDLKLGETRLICNPLGYPGEYKPGPAYREKLIIEV